jgi:hypothetical protein
LEAVSEASETQDEVWEMTWKREDLQNSSFINPVLEAPIGTVTSESENKTKFHFHFWKMTRIGLIPIPNPYLSRLWLVFTSQLYIEVRDRLDPK